MQMHTISDARPFHRAAVLASVDVVAAVRRDDLARPTPCAGWNLLDLLAHMPAQHHGFAAAAADVLDAFAADRVLDATFSLPEFGPGASFPGAIAIGFHFVDYVVHGWDVARSIGAPFALPHDVVAAVLPLVFVIPDGDYRAMDGAPFGPAVAAPDGATDIDRILGHLGRPPDWKP